MLPSTVWGYATCFNVHYEHFATHTHTLGILAICCYLLTKWYNGMGECIFRGSNSPEGIRKWGSPLILAGLRWEVPTPAFKKGQLPVPQGQSMSAPWFIKYMAIWVFEFRLEIGMPPVLPLGCQVLQTCLRSPGTTLDRSWSGFEGLLLCTPSGVMNKDRLPVRCQLAGWGIPTTDVRVTYQGGSGMFWILGVCLQLSQHKSWEFDLENPGFHHHLVI